MISSQDLGSGGGEQKPGRLIICNKDIRRVLGISRRSACRVIARIRQQHNKAHSDMISIDEFCAHCKLNRAEVIRLLF